ncbi:hypothetical protein CONPUDRAFT_169617 [Coniophora puteana RWD-64-598 SS2]|uniref:F-box domain-containing protein n=1 Tax=Coniophora puteana (strain RWD-64-598) TaxID=741705 RepID=A0A5M3M8Y3_CONPW|nr:uncharacterized protein CONPUDRAFT_169617 [Coniophora puteana RWD-64-598 SS2]EIW75225.1 hypothetical protein CONPUDRAFT_169617 [Coniophora puteana RWD-64-598 SS2]
MRRRVSQLLRIRDRPPPTPPPQTEPWYRPSNADMHWCLRLPETLGLIFDFVEDRDTLLSLARVCTQFVVMATDRLPQHLSNIYELLMALPHDLWELKVLRDKSVNKRWDYLLPWVITFVREVTPEEWKILLVKTARVKTIGVRSNRLDYPSNTTSTDHDTQDPRVFRGRILEPDTTVVEALSKCPADILFPNLRCLRGQIPGSLIPKVLSPSLRHLQICTLEAGRGDIWYNRIPTAAECCPELRSFVVVWDNDYLLIDSVADRCRLVPHFVSQWDHLQSYTGPADEQILYHFSRLPELESLAVWLDLERSVRPAGATTGNRLRKLRSLRCLTSSLEHIVKALEILFGTEAPPTSQYTRPALQRFCAQGFHLRESVSATVSAIANYVALDALESFRVLNHTCPLFADTASVYELLRPLSMFPSLTDVYFPYVTHHPVSYGRLTAPQLLDLARAWPNLRELEVAHPGVEFTVLEVAALRRYCPQLQRVPSASIRTDKHDLAAIAADPGVLERAGLA